MLQLVYEADDGGQRCLAFTENITVVNAAENGMIDGQLALYEHLSRGESSDDVRRKRIGSIYYQMGINGANRTSTPAQGKVQLEMHDYYGLGGSANDFGDTILHMSN